MNDQWRGRRATLHAVGAALAVLFVATAVRGGAVCDSTEACLRTIEQSQRSTHALLARFRQTKYLSLLAEPLVTTGRFAFKPPDQILWQIDDPAITVRIDRKGLHLPDLPNAAAETASVAPFSNVLRELAGVFTGSVSAVRDSFEVRAEGDADGIRLHLVPRRPDWQRMLHAIDMSFAMPDLVVKTMRIDESLGDHLEIVFSDIHRNDAVAAAALADEH